jgi:hypothetical protein
MKNLLFSLFALLFAVPAFATTTLHIPLFIEGDNDPVPAAEINQKLKAVGAPLIPEYVDITTQDDGYKMLKNIDAQIAASLKFLGKDYEYVGRNWELVPGDNNQGSLVTCYRGDAAEVVGIVADLADVTYSDQLNLFGWKYKAQTNLMADDEDGSLNEFLGEGSDQWKNWRGDTEDLLILAAVSDDGDDVNSSLIPRCK